MYLVCFSVIIELLCYIETYYQASAELADALVLGAAESPVKKPACELVVAHIGEKAAHAHKCVYLVPADGAGHFNLEIAVDCL